MAISRDEFIKSYIEDSGMPDSYIRDFGYELPNGIKQYAHHCYCGRDDCSGWLMSQHKEDPYREDTTRRDEVDDFLAESKALICNIIKEE